jgi:hypothetical protein
VTGRAATLQICPFDENMTTSKNVGRDHTRHTSCYFKQEDGKHQSTLWVGDKHQKCREVL